jgi:hypothetical protein
VSTCAAVSLRLAEPLAATTPVATGWLVLEQPGPWGRAALTDSHLDLGVARELEDRLAGSGVRILLIRRPGPHPDRPARPRQVFLAHTAPGAAWLEGGLLDHPKDVLDLDLAALAAGRRTGFGTAPAAPPLLVCTNGRRDRCCALLGRGMAGGLADRHAGRVWECSHLGGHRFAPTLLVLPAGTAYGRVDEVLADRVAAAAAAGHVELAGYRGRSTWERPGQAAEIAVRGLLGETGADALSVARAVPGAPDRWTAAVSHADGGAWTVEIARTVADVPRPESCGKEPGRPDRYSAVAVHAQ